MRAAADVRRRQIARADFRGRPAWKPVVHSEGILRTRSEPERVGTSLSVFNKSDIHITIAGTAGSRILPELERDPADLEVVKKRYSAFFRTDLDHLLQDLRAGSVIVAGINTHACVRMAVIDAFQRDLDVILATECVGSYDAAHHAVTLDYLQGKMARLLTNAQIAQLLEERVV